MKKQVKAANESSPHTIATRIVYNYLCDCRDEWKNSKYRGDLDDASAEEVDTEIMNILNKIGSEILWR